MRDDAIAISVTDDASGLLIWSGEMTLVDFSRCITGLACMRADVKKIINKHDLENIGKEKLTKTVQLVGIFDFEARSNKKVFMEFINLQAIRQHQELFRQGWFLADDGTTRQQNHSPMWNVIFVKYKELNTEDMRVDT
jgi:hypothetical protein